MITGKKCGVRGLEGTMASNHCRICGRALKNPTSVKIGIGPICRAKDNKQGEFDFMKAKFTVEKHESGVFIFIRDIGHDTGRTVTNDAEYVIEKLYEEYGITDGTRIFYEDSEGSIDEIVHSGKQFIKFLPGHKGVDL